MLDVIDGIDFTGTDNTPEAVTNLIRTRLNEIFNTTLSAGSFFLTVNGNNASLAEGSRPAPSYIIGINDFNCTMQNTGITNQYDYSISFTATDKSNKMLRVEADIRLVFDNGNFQPSVMQVLAMNYGE